MARNVGQYIIIHLFQGAFGIDYRSIWCRDFTINCITEKLKVKNAGDVHKYYRAENSFAWPDNFTCQD